MCGQSLRWAIIEYLPANCLIAKAADVATTTKSSFKENCITIYLQFGWAIKFKAFVMLLNLVLFFMLTVIFFLHLHLLLKFHAD